MGGDFNDKNTDWSAKFTTGKGAGIWKAIRESDSDFHSSGRPKYWPTDNNKLPDLLYFIEALVIHITNWKGFRKNSPNGIDLNVALNTNQLDIELEIFFKIFQTVAFSNIKLNS